MLNNNTYLLGAIVLGFSKTSRAIFIPDNDSLFTYNSLWLLLLLIASVLISIEG